MKEDYMESTIEKYRHELLEYSRNHPKAGEKTDEVYIDEAEAAEEAEEIAVMDYDVLRKNIATKEGKGCSSDSSVECISEKTVSASSAEMSNDEEKTYESQGEAFPPYNNGTVVEYRNKTQFMQNNAQNGFLRVQVSAADQSFPIQNAKVVVSKNFDEDSSVFYSSYTDASGIMPRVTLPAPDRALASEPSGLQPYSTYDVLVEHPGFTRVICRNCAVFEGIETIQMVELIPQSDMGGE